MRARTTFLWRWTRSLPHSPGSEITPGEAETIAGVVDTFVRAIETTKKDNSRFNLLQILRAGEYDEENYEDDSDGGDYEEAGEYEETDDCQS